MSNNPLAYVRDHCGTIVSLDLFDTVRGLDITPTRVTLGIDAAQYTGGRGGQYRIVKRGIVLHVFDLHAKSGTWSRSTVPVWWSTDELIVPFSVPDECECPPVPVPVRTKARKNGYRGEARPRRA